MTTLKQAERRFLKLAVDLLREDAENARRSCEGRLGDWACNDCGERQYKCQAQEDYEIRVQTANDLTAMLKRKPRVR